MKGLTDQAGQDQAIADARRQAERLARRREQDRALLRWLRGDQ